MRDLAISLIILAVVPVLLVVFVAAFSNWDMTLVNPANWHTGGRVIAAGWVSFCAVIYAAIWFRVLIN